MPNTPMTSKSSMTPTKIPIKTLPLTPIDPDTLTVYANPNDLRRDLHTFVGYVSGRAIKRSYRGNDLPQADYKRLGRLIKDDSLGLGALSDDDGYDDDTSYGHAYNWIAYLDRLALKLGFVGYNTKGEYRGYSSQEPSFPDNFMRFNADAYHKFLALSLAAQERRLRDTLTDDYTSGYNEFYATGIHGRLDRFPTFGSNTGVMSTLDFAAVRRFLLDLLPGYEQGVWHSVADLVAYLKINHPYFLIPKKLPVNKYYKTSEKRYGNFHEYKDAYLYDQSPIPDDAPDAFERVEGRYVERFLEGLPLTHGYVDVAYADQSEPAAKPSRGLLKAFRINERFIQAMRGDIPQPIVTVQPTFEIYIESAFYPASLINRLSPLADVVREDTTSILKLHKQKVAAALAETAGLDVITLLKDVSGRELPQNVTVELEEWTGLADVFTLYDGFGLVESADTHAAVDAGATVTISGSLRLARDPGALFARLTDAGAIALRVRHGDTALEALPAKARTVFARKAAPSQAPAKGAKKAVTLRREALIVLHVPDDSLFDDLRKALLEARCVLELNKEKRALTLAAKDEALIKEVIKGLSDAYTIRVEDMV